MSGHQDAPRPQSRRPGARAMVRRWLELHKPTGSARTQLLMAELMWTSVGSVLLGLGLYWVVERYHGPGWAYATPFLALGLLKALFILDRVARRTIERVLTRGDDHCLGGFFSASSWLAIVGMIVLGQLLRASPIPRADVGFLYVTVGSGLLMSSRTFWAAWWHLRPRGATDRTGNGRRPM